MIELDAVIGTLIGLVTGLMPSVVNALWKECKVRGERKERQAERDHALELKKLDDQHETIQHGLNRGYLVIVEEGSASYEPQSQP